MIPLFVLLFVSLTSELVCDVGGVRTTLRENCPQSSGRKNGLDTCPAFRAPEWGNDASFKAAAYTVIDYIWGASGNLIVKVGFPMPDNGAFNFCHYNVDSRGVTSDGQPPCQESGYCLDGIWRNAFWNSSIQKFDPIRPGVNPYPDNSIYNCKVSGTEDVNNCLYMDCEIDLSTYVQTHGDFRRETYGDTTYIDIEFSRCAICGSGVKGVNWEYECPLRWVGRLGYKFDEVAQKDVSIGISSKESFTGPDGLGNIHVHVALSEGEVGEEGYFQYRSGTDPLKFDLVSESCVDNLCDLFGISEIPVPEQLITGKFYSHVYTRNGEDIYFPTTYSLSSHLVGKKFDLPLQIYFAAEIENFLSKPLTLIGREFQFYILAYGSNTSMDEWVPVVDDKPVIRRRKKEDRSIMEDIPVGSYEVDDITDHSYVQRDLPREIDQTKYYRVYRVQTEYSFPVDLDYEYAIKKTTKFSSKGGGRRIGEVEGKTRYDSVNGYVQPEGGLTDAQIGLTIFGAISSPFVLICCCCSPIIFLFFCACCFSLCFILLLCCSGCIFLIVSIFGACSGVTGMGLSSNHSKKSLGGIMYRNIEQEKIDVN